LLIRPATAGDLPDVTRVHAITWKSAYAGIVPKSYLAGLSPEASLARWRERYPDYPVLPDGEELVAEVDARVVGFVSLGRVRDDGMPAHMGEVWALYVLPEVQGAGLGSALLAGGLARLHALGLGPVVLWVLESNTSARAYYERRGFSLDGGRKHWARDGWSLPQVRYRLDGYGHPSGDRNVSRP